MEQERKFGAFLRGFAESAGRRLGFIKSPERWLAEMLTEDKNAQDAVEKILNGPEFQGEMRRMKEQLRDEEFQKRAKEDWIRELREYNSRQNQ